VIEGYVTKQEVVDMLLDLRNQFEDKFSGYIGDVVVSDFFMDIDDKMRGLSVDS
jgi:hypothetical protein